MLKDKAQYNEYMRLYMKRMWNERRKLAVDHLGGKCVKCGSVHKLEFDHIDPSTKSFTIASRPSASNKRFWEEIAKCQLLCEECHKRKSKLDDAQGNRDRITICNCGRTFTTVKAYAGHRTKCKI
jgi:5-methylcytosine-specific restriction endonuclease McrA